MTYSQTILGVSFPLHHLMHREKFLELILGKDKNCDSEDITVANNCYTARNLYLGFSENSK